VTAESVHPLTAARRNGGNRRRRKWQMLSTGSAPTGGDHGLGGRQNRRSRPLVSVSSQRPTLADPRGCRSSEPHSSSSTRTSRRSLQADLANLRAHNERLRHQNAKLTERLSEVLGEPVFHDAGLTPTNEIEPLRKRVAELEQQPLDSKQDIQNRDDELATARAANRYLITILNRPTP
jgi:hypothetical protein